MKRVLFVIKTLCRGGAERVLSNIIVHFPEDWQIDLLIDDRSLLEYPYKGRLLSLSMPEKSNPVYFVGNIVKRTVCLYRLKKNGGYDACISFLDSSNISNVLSGHRYCKTFVSIHSNILSPNLKPIERFAACFLAKRLYIYADEIVVVSKEIEQEMINKLKICGNKIRTIVNGCDRRWIQGKMKSVPQNMVISDALFHSNCRIIMTVGRMVDPKGQWHLIRAFSKVIKSMPQARLVLVGDGPLQAYLTALVNCCGLEDSVFFAGRCDNPFWYLAHADVFVLSSLYEGYPNALAEAICCDVPCIAADVHSGVREILAPALDVTGERVQEITAEEYGILIPACSGRKYKGEEPLEQEERKLAEAILVLLADREKWQHYREKSKERSKDLEINAIVDSWINAIAGR